MAKGFFRHKDIALKSPDTTIVFRRSDIWGYADHKGRLMRIFNNRHFKVLCDKGFIIYNIYSPTKKSYFFSKNLNSPIYKLNSKNLNTVFCSMPEFIHKLNTSQRKMWMTRKVNTDCYFINELFPPQGRIKQIEDI